MPPRPRLTAALLVLLGNAAFLFPPAPSFADDYVPEQVIIRLGPLGNLAAINAAWGTTTLDSIPDHDTYLLHQPNATLLDSMVTTLGGNLEVVYADFNYNSSSPEARRYIVVIAIGGTGDDVEDQGAVERVRAPDANALTGGAGSLVATLDTGAETDHPFLAGHLETSCAYDFVDDDLDPYDSSNDVDDDGDGLVDGGAGHGTMVAGIIRTIAPEAMILPVRVLDDEGRGTAFMVTEGIFHAVDAGADVLNMSLGTTSDSEAIHDGLVWARALSVAVVAAAGNDSAYAAYYPARDSLAIGVTAADSADVKAALANYHPTIDLSSPGVGILSSYRDGGYGIGTGTSFAAPFVSATLALVRAFQAETAPESLSVWTQEGSEDISGIPENQPWLGGIGAGRIDCLGALVSAAPPTGVPLAGAPAAAAGSGGLELLPNAPNPAADATRIRFRLSQPGPVWVELFSGEGRLLRGESFGPLSAGGHEVPLAANRGSGERLPPGVYFYRVRTLAGAGAGRLTIVR